MYDISRHRTLEDIERTWINEMAAHASEHLVVLLVGNKADLEEREVPQEEGRAVAQVNI